MFKTAELSAELAQTMETGGLAAGVDGSELLCVPVQNGFREAQIRAGQNMADLWWMSCQLMRSHLQDQKDGHLKEEWWPLKKVERDKVTPVTAETSGDATDG